MRRALPLLVAIAAVAAVIVPYLALGGASYDPTPVADPCAPRDARDAEGFQGAIEQIALSALDAAACDLGVSREDLVLAVRDEESLDAFAEEHGIPRAEAEQAIENGLDRALDDAEADDALPGLVLTLIRAAVDAVPPWLILDAIEELSDLVP